MPATARPARSLRLAVPAAAATALVVALLPTTAGPAAATASPTATPTPVPATATPTPVVTTVPVPCGGVATTTITPTPTAVSSPSATATATATATAAPAPTPSGSSAPAPAPGCTAPPRVEVEGEVTPGVAGVVTVVGFADREVWLHAYSQPSTTYQVVRRGVVGSDGRVVFRLLPGTNTRLFASYAGSSQGPSEVLVVRTALSLSAVRTGTRAYVLQGRVLPRRAGQLVTVYRRAGGRDVITAQTRTDSTGTYRTPRTFGAAGPVDLFARTGETATNAAGSSPGLRLQVR